MLVPGGSIIFWVSFAAGGTGANHKIDGVMSKEYLTTSVGILKVWAQIGLSNGQRPEANSQSGYKVAYGQQSQYFGVATTKLWSHSSKEYEGRSEKGVRQLKENHQESRYKLQNTCCCYSSERIPRSIDSLSCETVCFFFSHFTIILCVKSITQKCIGINKMWKSLMGVEKLHTSAGTAHQTSRTKTFDHNTNKRNSFYCGFLFGRTTKNIYILCLYRGHISLLVQNHGSLHQYQKHSADIISSTGQGPQIWPTEVLLCLSIRGENSPLQQRCLRSARRWASTSCCSWSLLCHRTPGPKTVLCCLLAGCVCWWRMEKFTALKVFIFNINTDFWLYLGSQVKENLPSGKYVRGRLTLTLGKYKGKTARGRSTAG